MKLSELRDLLRPENVQQSIFNNFENSIKEILGKYAVFMSLEKELQKINAEAWEFFKTEIASQMLALKNGRGYEAFLNIVNQVYAYSYLKDRLGCSNVAFIKTDEKETPDLEADLDGVKVLCEVKTINPSDDEVRRRNIIKNGGVVVGVVQNKLPDRFFGKLNSILKKAKSQLLSYLNGGVAHKLIFLVINFDDIFGEYKEEFYVQIDAHLQGNPLGDFELVIFNKKTAFYKDIAMNSATVVNDA